MFWIFIILIGNELQLQEPPPGLFTKCVKYIKVIVVSIKKSLEIYKKNSHLHEYNK